MASKKPKPFPALVADLQRLEAELKAAGVSPHLLNPVRAELQTKIESLPVHWEGVKKKPAVAFILAGGEWWPVHAAEEITHGILAGGLNVRTDYEDGSAESGPVKVCFWAHCTADETPNYFWLDPLEEPVSEQEAADQTTPQLGKSFVRREDGGTGPSGDPINNGESNEADAS